MKICLILSGQNRFTEETSLAVNKFLPYDTYCHFWDNNDSFLKNLEHLKKFSTSDFKQSDFIKSYHKSLEPMFYSLKVAYNLIDNPYDLYIRFRPDLLPIDFFSNEEMFRSINENILYSGFFGDDMKAGYLDRDIGLYDGTLHSWVSDMFWFCNFNTSKIIFNIYDYLDFMQLICPELCIGMICDKFGIKYSKSNFRCLFDCKTSPTEFFCNYNNLTSRILIHKR